MRSQNEDRFPEMLGLNPMTFPETALVGSYDYRLVSVSVLMAVLASYAALDLAARVTAAHGRVRLAWLTGGATAMGIGIWSMHYIGMLAFSLSFRILYDWPTVLLSLLAAVFCLWCCPICGQPSPHVVVSSTDWQRGNG